MARPAAARGAPRRPSRTLRSKAVPVEYARTTRSRRPGAPLRVAGRNTRAPVGWPSTARASAGAAGAARAVAAARPIIRFSIVERSIPVALQEALPDPVREIIVRDSLLPENAHTAARKDAVGAAREGGAGEVERNIT